MIRQRERGSAAVEMVLVAPALLVLLATVVGAGRVVTTKSAMLSIARESARAAAEAPDAATARTIAYERAAEIATDFGLDPARLEINEDPGSFDRGTPYTISITYRVELDDLPGLGFLPGSFVVSARHAELTDRYRSR